MEKIKRVLLLMKLLSDIPKAKVLIIGGAVRDHFMEGADRMFAGAIVKMVEASKDIDLEVYGVTGDQIVSALSSEFELDLVGRQFGVFKVKGLPIDISLPRTESCIGVGHKDFEVTVDPNMTTYDAAKRRDFTINSVAYDWTFNEPVGIAVVDHFGGIDDIRKRRLHPTSDKFAEDPLRPLRAMQFIARFDMTPSDELIEVCRGMKDKMLNLPKERVITEWQKLLLRGKRIDKGIQFLVDTGLIDLYPELKALLGVEQHPEYHPEGDAYVHTMHCLQAFVEKRDSLATDEDKLAVGFAVLGHDFGKATTTKRNELGKITAHGHEAASGPLVRTFMERMCDPNHDIVGLVEKLVVAHMRPVQVFNDSCNVASLRRISVAVDGRLDLLLAVVYCDQSGRPPLPAKLEAIEWVNKVLETQQLMPNQKIKPVIMGRHILALTQLQPGPQIGAILKLAFEAQLDGHFVDEATGIEYVKTHILK